MLKNTSSHYGSIAIFLHWLSALIVFAMLVSGIWMVELNYYSEWYHQAPFVHKSGGLLLFTLVVIRLIWRSLNASPNKIGSKVEQIAATLVHATLYLLIIAICFSGYLMSTADGRGISMFAWFEIPSLGQLFTNQEDWFGFVHQYTAYSLIVLVTIHVMGALKHHVVDRDNTLLRMFKNH